MTIRGQKLRLDLVDLFLVAEFAFITIRFYLFPGNAAVGIDAATYWAAANRWLHGEDPYVNLGGLVFAAPPPTLAVLSPFALLPLPAFGVVLLGGSLLAAIYLLRRLDLPIWWLLFPPLVEGLVVGNPNIIVVALLVAATPAGDAIAAFLKLYALLPIALLWRRRSIAWAVIALAVTAPILPWVAYLEHATEMVNVLLVQSSGGRSALAVPVLIPFALAALWVLGRKRAAWLVVPALWPATQLHYNAFALPTITRRMAAILAVPVAGAPAIAVIVEAAVELWRRRSGGNMPDTKTRPA